MTDPLDAPFATIGDLIAWHARQAPERPALVDGGGPADAVPSAAAAQRLGYGALDRQMDRIAAALQADGLRRGDAIAILAAPSVTAATVFLAALRAGIAVAPLAPGTAPQALARMLADSAARLLFVDAAMLAESPAAAPPRIVLDGCGFGGSDLDGGGLDGADLDRRGAGGRAGAGDEAIRPLSGWIDAAERAGAVFARPDIEPDDPFNIIYSSGTTGLPKGIVQPHRMRWAHVQRGRHHGYGPAGVTVLATPLYSNTTLVCFFPTLAYGGTVVLMSKFGVQRYLALCESWRATHTMLVPVQYQRLMASPDFDRHDLSAFIAKFCTSAPFPAALKADVLKRWPGGLIEFYGMTEGGGTCILEVHRHPDKLATVGRPGPGSDIRLIDEAGRELVRATADGIDPPQAAGLAGEVVGRSPGMMVGYHGQPDKTREAEWFDPDGLRFIRTGDIGRFDADGFLQLVDRRKDMIISGGFNIYPSDLEAVLQQHPAVAEAAVVGVPSAQWGESPAAFAVLRAPEPAAIPTASEVPAVTGADLLAWVNARVGKTQRLVSVTVLDRLPRSAIGKVLKRALRDGATAHRDLADRRADGSAQPETR